MLVLTLCNIFMYYLSFKMLTLNDMLIFGVIISLLGTFVNAYGWLFIYSKLPQKTKPYRDIEKIKNKINENNFKLKELNSNKIFFNKKKSEHERVLYIEKSFKENNSKYKNTYFDKECLNGISEYLTDEEIIELLKLNNKKKIF